MNITTADVRQWIEDYVREYPLHAGPDTSWRTPVIGTADADDPLFHRVKELTGGKNALPQELLPGARSVIVYFIPFSEEIVLGNRKGNASSCGWDIANIETNQLLRGLQDELHGRIRSLGRACTHMELTSGYDPALLLSEWSHKSAAYIAGLGTFGIHHTIITERGCCGRLGSVITDLALEATPRPSTEYCLFLRSGHCGICRQNCPAGAITTAGETADYDRWKCSWYIYQHEHYYSIGSAAACGKCMCSGPCAMGIPGEAGR